jgi:hypothetical protein
MANKKIDFMNTMLYMGMEDPGDRILVLAVAGYDTYQDAAKELEITSGQVSLGVPQEKGRALWRPELQGPRSMATGGRILREAMPVLTEREIEDGYEIHHKGHVYVADDLPNDNGWAPGHDENGRDCDMRFVWTMTDYWCFVDADLAEHEKETGECA